MLAKTIVFTIRIYKIFISPVLLTVFGRGCKYEVSCSTFAIQSIENEGLSKGLPKSLKRFLSCQNYIKI